ncbi:aminotransferase class V-fold PLP-dependent enzyme [Duganella sp. HH105]|uniref:aminotransferase class V-fold PLP-dependent enzyme n=1 Tax=Duganella sp. HH105 TaxID=1781067 RepID=UPI000877DAF9|nr:aminotransferase class V-fold PLP-dependent enzyme [Duganella sp. HH105]OEZ63617.1 isopenicillin N epimerase [Duganella sp. HH105]
MLNRRSFFHVAAGVAGGSLIVPPALADLPPAAEALPQNESYWAKVAAQYDPAPDFINLEQGYFGMMARPVAEEYKRNIDYLNSHSSRFLRQEFDGSGIEAIRAQIAMAVDADISEIAITRGATESLQNLIVNYKPLKAGDTIMYADLDYDATQYAMNELALRRGAEVAVVRIPEPPGRQAILDAYAQAMRRHPRTRLLLLTHISHRTGLTLPVAELTEMARQRGIDVIADAAQSWGQTDFTVADLKADFIGFNLHKWLGAPLGVGFMYIRKARLADIAVHMSDQDYAATDIRSRVHSGTVNTANIMTVPAAFRFHEQIGVANKSARLKYLRNYWVERVRGVKGLQILTPDDPSMYGASTSFRFAGKTSKEDNQRLARRLMDEHGIFTVSRNGPIGGSCVRVTPALFTTTRQLDRLARAIATLG